MQTDTAVPGSAAGPGDADRHRVPDAVAGVLGGLAAGLACLVAQASVAATVLGGSAADPLLRTRPCCWAGAAPGSGSLDLTTGGIA